jgi:hypothetical protein
MRYQQRADWFQQTVALDLKLMKMMMSKWKRYAKFDTFFKHKSSSFAAKTSSSRFYERTSQFLPR